MKKFIIVLSSIFELIFYTFFMVLIESVEITNSLLSLVVHFLALFIVASAFYFLVRFVFNKLDMKAKKYIYYVVISNIIIGTIAPVLLIIIIPSEILTTFTFILLVSAIYYGLLINVIISFLNHFPYIFIHHFIYSRNKCCISYFIFI